MQEPTKVGTPCEHCGKPIGRGMVKAYPFTRYCKGTCLSGAAIADLQRRIDGGLPLFDNMVCADCGGELKVYARSLKDNAATTLNICVNCHDSRDARRWTLDYLAYNNAPRARG